MGRLYVNQMLEKQIRQYCELNEIEDINAFANRCLSQGFNIVKFGVSPSDNKERENNGIKDLKNESRRKRKEQPRVSREEKRSEEKEDTGTVLQGKKEGSESSQPRLETHEEESKPIEERKQTVTVRKIQIIKKK